MRARQTLAHHLFLLERPLVRESIGYCRSYPIRDIECTAFFKFLGLLIQGKLNHLVSSQSCSAQDGKCFFSAVNFYSRFNALKLSFNASISRLTEDFVVKLQTDFPGTISTLFRTGDKLKSMAVRSDSVDSSCVLCGATIEEAPQCSAFTARCFSRTVSQAGPRKSVDVLQAIHVKVIN